MTSSEPAATTSAVIGPGAIGGALAGAIVEAGNTPMLCARTPFDELVVDHPAGRIVAPRPALTDPSDVSPVDIVVCTVKAHQTESAGAWLRALTGPDTTVVIAQNGVEQEHNVDGLVHPQADLVPAVIWCPAQRQGPGQITVSGPARLTVPHGPGAERLAALVAGSFFEIRTSSDWLSRAWDKLLINSALGGVGVLTGRPGSELAADPVTRELILDLMAEAVLVGRAEGATIADERPQQILDGMLQSGLRHVSSIVVDRQAGAPTEWRARNEVIERLGTAHGIETPLNRRLTALIRMGEPQN